MIPPVYVVHGMTESGDYWNLVFRNSPSENDILNSISDNPWLAGEYAEECLQGWSIVETYIIHN